MERAPGGGSGKGEMPVDANAVLAGQVPEWINGEFFQRTLWSDTNEPGMTVKSCEVTPATALGDNYASILYRAKLETQDGETRSVILKCLPSNQVRQMVSEQLGQFKREILVYQHVLPIYTKMYREIMGAQGSPPWPECLYSKRDGVSDVIVLEDLKPEGFEMADRKNGLTEQELSLALSSLGLFHAFSLAYKTEDPASFQTNVREACGKIPESAFQMFKPMMMGSMNEIEDLVRGWGHQMEADVIARMKESLVEDMLEEVEAMDEETAVLNHGDFWLNNFLFRERPGGGPFELKMIDFQMPRYGSPALDLTYLVVTSTKKEIRREHWLRLLEEAYLSSLHDALEKLGYSKVLKDGMFSMKWLKEELAKKRLFAFYTSITTTAGAMAEADDVPDMDAMKQEDIEGKKDIFSQLIRGKAYQERFRDLFDEFLEEGFFK